MDKPLVNRVASSNILNINLETYFPKQQFGRFDIADYLFKGLILREKDFRLALKEFDWDQFKEKIVCVECTSDVIIPLWAYMLIASYTVGHAYDVYNGSQEEYLKMHYKKSLNQIDLEAYDDQRVIIKGCGDKPVPAHAYLYLTFLLKPIVKSLMFGEACSSVPIFKKPRK